VISHGNEHVADEESSLFAAQLRKKSTFKVLGPSELHRIQDRHRRRILCKGKDLAEMKRIVREVVQDFRINKRRCTLSVDVNPQRLD
jgi:primosomal protein N'